MNFYYGLITLEDYGFVDENDDRAKQEGLIKLTEEEHQKLLDEQSQGKEIVFYNGKVFTANPGLYYLDENRTWQKKDDTQYEQELFEHVKENKKQEASQKAYEYINNGAMYEFEEGKHIEANDGNISKLGLAAIELVLNQDTESTIEWCTYEDEIVNLNAVQLQRIVQGLKNEQSRVWTELYPEFLKQIEKAKTIAELKVINIDYETLRRQQQ